MITANDAADFAAAVRRLAAAQPGPRTRPDWVAERDWSKLVDRMNVEYEQILTR